MKKYTFSTLLLIILLTSVSCNQTSESAKQFDAIRSRALQLDSVLNRELEKAKQLDSLVTTNLDHLEKLDQKIRKEAAVVDSVITRLRR